MASALRADGAVVTESEYVALGITQTLTRVVYGDDQVRLHARKKGLPLVLLVVLSCALFMRTRSYRKSALLPKEVYTVTNLMRLSDGTELVAKSHFDRLPDEAHDSGAGNAAAAAGT
jgi:hypothetical protein